MYGDRYEAYSAGVAATAVDPRAVVVMKEIGIDISGQHSKSYEEFQDTIFDLAVTVCDRANRPVLSAAYSGIFRPDLPKQEKSFTEAIADPAASVGSEEEQLKVFRQVRDEIKEWISQTFGG
jgi:arsenate reductase